MLHDVRGDRAATSMVVVGLSLLARLLLPALRLFLLGLHERRRRRFHLFQCCDLDLCSSQHLLCRSQLLLGPPQLLLRLDQFSHHVIQFFRQPCDLLVCCHLCQFIRKVKSEPLRPVELLPDREAASVARWLREHPGVKLISRNRAGMYAEGARRGAPRARQIADRYHLLVNLRDALKDALACRQDVLPVVDKHGKEAGSSSQDPAHPSPSSPMPAEATPQQEWRGAQPRAQPLSADTQRLSASQRRQQISQANRYARYQQIRALSEQGLNQREIARHLHLSRGCVHRYVTAERFPERALPGKRRSLLDPHLPYLRQRWEEGCHNRHQLAREIKAQGFRGSASLVRQLLGGWCESFPALKPGVRGPKRQTPTGCATRCDYQMKWLWAFVYDICDSCTKAERLYSY